MAYETKLNPHALVFGNGRYYPSATVKPRAAAGTIFSPEVIKSFTPADRPQNL